jgi:NADH-quinone oxidoreductase subunit M
MGFGQRRLTKCCALLQLLVVLFLCANYSNDTGGFQFTFSSGPLLPHTDLSFSLGADGLSLLLLLLNASVTSLAVWFSPQPSERSHIFDACVLLLSAAASGAFASQDLFFFYAFHELALIPTFLLIGRWGFGEKQAAAWKITIYLTIGSVVLLIGLVDLFTSIPEGSRSFDLSKLQKLGSAHAIPTDAQVRPWCFILVGTAVLVSLFPFHSWAPSAYVSSPTPVSMLHAGVLKKFGAYAVIRIALPLLPDAWRSPILLGLTGCDLVLYAVIANLLYIGLATIAQRRIDYILGYSSVMHMGYIFLGICSLNIIGLNGAVLLIFSHGLTISALFAVMGFLRERRGTLSVESFGGLASSLPFLSISFALATFASIGLPGFINFAGETLVFFGAYKEGFRGAIRVATVVGLWGLIISAVYMLRAYRLIFLGPPVPATTAWVDLASSQKVVLGLALVLMLTGGFFPNLFINFVKPCLDAVIR